MSTAKNPTVDVEQALQALEAVVNELEQGDLNLEQALNRFEQGITLARQCQSALEAAEQRVERLLQLEENAGTGAFDPGSET